MSQEFIQTPEENPLPPKPKKNNKWLLIGTIVALLGVNLYLFLNRNEISRDKVEVEQQFAVSDSSRKAVEGEYRAALIRLDELVSQNTQMDSLINTRNSEVAKLRAEIDAIISDKNASEANLGKAKRLIATLNSTIRGYEEQIAMLEKENETLTGANAVLAQERDSTVTQNIALQQKVRLASVLHASNIRMVPIDLRRGGRKLKPTERAKRVDVLRIYFDIDENRIAEDGNKELFLRITGPDGQVLSNAAYGSGVTYTSDNQPLNYTLAKQIPLKQGEPVKDVIVDWNQDSDYKRGDYQIEIFHEGYAVGSGQVNLH